jgi:hypothetical protein
MKGEPVHDVGQAMPSVTKVLEIAQFHLSPNLQKLINSMCPQNTGKKHLSPDHLKKEQKRSLKKRAKKLHHFGAFGDRWNFGPL